VLGTTVFYSSRHDSTNQQLTCRMIPTTAVGTRLRGDIQKEQGFLPLSPLLRSPPSVLSREECSTLFPQSIYWSRGNSRYCSVVRTMYLSAQVLAVAVLQSCLSRSP
ncbi:unnamed protein product, partial [Ectocarpus sp. 12 AP-2014]